MGTLSKSTNQQKDKEHNMKWASEFVVNGLNVVVGKQFSGEKLSTEDTIFVDCRFTDCDFEIAQPSFKGGLVRCVVR